MSEQNPVPKFVLIADMDASAAKILRSALLKLGVEAVLTVSSGEDALKRIRDGSIEMLIVDWKLSDVSGLQLLNRLRQEPKSLMLPLLMTSGVLKEADFRLLDDFPLTRLLIKPVDKVVLSSQVWSIWEEAIWYDRNTESINGIVQHLAEGTPDALDAFTTLLNASPNKLPLGILAVRIMREHGQLPMAEGLARMLLNIDPKCVMVLNELGKIYHQQGNYSLAIRTLRDAVSLSPNNIERLCLLGENELKTNDLPSARKHFISALDLDQANPKAAAGKLVVKNIEEYYRGRDPNETTKGSFASLCNTIGISMVKTGRFDDGMKQYESAMHFASNDLDSARVAYNLGLGFVRWKKPTDAHKWFLKSVELSGGKFEKATELASRVGVALGIKPETPAFVEKSTPLHADKDTPKAPSIDFDHESFFEDFSDGTPTEPEQKTTKKEKLEEDPL
jgi:CheY-like chemotaxis protein